VTVGKKLPVLFMAINMRQILKPGNLLQILQRA